VAASLELHPDRQAMLDTSAPPAPAAAPPKSRLKKPTTGPNCETANNQRGRERQKQRSKKPDPFAKEMEKAEKIKQEREARRKEKELKIKEREAMTRATKPDQFGKRRLGRESKVLLSKVQRIVGEV
jgi:hypothetical protein